MWSCPQGSQTGTAETPGRTAQHGSPLHHRSTFIRSPLRVANLLQFCPFYETTRLVSSVFCCLILQPLIRLGLWSQRLVVAYLNMETITSHYTASKELIWNELWLLHCRWRTNCDGQTVLLCSQVRGWRSTDSCSCNLCWQTEHLSCCAGFDRRARDHWSRCRRPRPLSSPPPLGWCSSPLGWNVALGLWRTPVQGGLRWEEKKTRKPPATVSAQVPDDAPWGQSWTLRLHC